jgi:uncharacterized protein YdhG (YjbR/CyaY superfamily)
MHTTIDDYIASFPIQTQKALKEIRAFIRIAAPDAEEKISYAIPTFHLNGNLVHFAGFKNHIGFYPGPSGIEAFKKKLSRYKGAKGSVQFPLNESIPYDLIIEIVQFRILENTTKTTKKSNLRTCKLGHKFNKTSDCPTCPICEKARVPKADWMTAFGAPARRAFESAGLIQLKEFSKHTETEIKAMHGLGPSSLTKLTALLKQNNIHFKKQ